MIPRLSQFSRIDSYLSGHVGERDDVDEVVVAESVEDVVDDMSGDLPPYTRHAAGGVHQDENILGTGSRFDVPAPRSAVEQIHRLHVPIHGGILAHEAARAAKVLPGQRRILLVVVDEDAIELFGPLDRPDNVRRALVHVRRHMHCRHVEIHVAAEVRTVIEIDGVVLRVDELVGFRWILVRRRHRRLLRYVHYSLKDRKRLIVESN